MMPSDEPLLSVTLDAAIVELFSAWIRSDIPTARTEMLRETLEIVRRIFSASRALIVWEEADEPWVNIASLDERRSRLETERAEDV